MFSLGHALKLSSHLSLEVATPKFLTKFPFPHGFLEQWSVTSV